MWYVLKQVVLVANISDPAILGLDFIFFNCEIESWCQTLLCGCLIEANPDFEQSCALKLASCLTGELIW